MMTKELLDLSHKYRLEEIEAERKMKLEVERIRHEDALGEIRFKKASKDISRGKR